MVCDAAIRVPLQALYLHVLHAFRVQVLLTNLSFDYARKVNNVVISVVVVVVWIICSCNAK